MSIGKIGRTTVMGDQHEHRHNADDDGFSILSTLS